MDIKGYTKAEAWTALSIGVQEEIIKLNKQYFFETDEDLKLEKERKLDKAIYKALGHEFNLVSYQPQEVAQAIFIIARDCKEPLAEIAKDIRDKFSDIASAATQVLKDRGFLTNSGELKLSKPYRGK